MRPDACSGRTWRYAEARDATGTRPQGAGRSAGQPRRSAIRGAESPRHSAGREATGGPECSQAVPVCAGQQTFFKCLYSDCPCPQDRQQGQGPHGEGDMAIPARPTPHLIVIEAHFALGCLEAFSIVHRVPATGTTASKVVAWGAQTT